jgi:glycosyltransferase involved in cell wall biosynthesis
LGGAETILLETIEILRERGIECRAILPAIGEFSNCLTSLGIPFAILPVPWWMSSRKLSLLSQMKSARRIAVAALRTAVQVWRWKCDVVYSNTITVCTGAFAAAILRRPHVWHIQEFGPEDHGLVFHFGEARSVRLLGYLSASCIALSRALKGKLAAHIAPSKISVVYPSMHIAITKNAGSLARQPGLHADRVFRCLIVGRLAQGKRQEDAIRAVACLLEDGISTELVIVGAGDPSYRQRLEELVRQKGLRERVTFVGEVPDASPFIATSDVLLMCSRSEGFGRVTIEGMLAGKPVIGARGGASPELVQDGSTGLLYAAGDPRDLALKIRELYENREYAEALGRNAKCWVGTVFTKERYVMEMLPILDSLQHGTRSKSFRSVSHEFPFCKSEHNCFRKP